MINNFIPNWDLSTLWNGFNSPEYSKSIKILQENLQKLSRLLDEFSNMTDMTYFNKTLLSYLELDNQTSALHESLYAYAYSMYATNTTNQEALNNLSILDEINLQVNDIDLQFQKIIYNHFSLLKNFFEENPNKQNYEYIFNQIVFEYQHNMSYKEEKLACDLQRFGADAWSKLQEQIISNLTDKETGKTFNELRNDAYSPDRNVRKMSYYKEIELLQQNEITFAACLNNIKGATLSLNKKRNWTKPLQRSLFSSRLSETSLNALIKVIEDSLPMWQEFLEYKSKLLNLTDDSNQRELCQFYDILAPLPTKYAKNWTFSEASEFITKMFYSFSKDMGDFVSVAFQNNWIDAKISEGKLGGAFCIDFPTQKCSRVLSNFSGSTSDVLTLAHELGHAYHYHCIKDQDYYLSSYPMTLAETASLFSETMVTKQMLQSCSSQEKITLLEMHLSDSFQTLVDILSRFYFERSVFEQREENELGAKDFCKLMIDAQNKTYGKSLGKIKHPYLWAVKSHYYSGDFDFYNYPYAFGQLLASALYKNYLNDKSTFPDNYRKLLSQTGCNSCENVCKVAGFDITKTNFWYSGIELLHEEFNELKSLTKGN